MWTVHKAASTLHVRRYRPESYSTWHIVYVVATVERLQTSGEHVCLNARHPGSRIDLGLNLVGATSFLLSHSHSSGTGATLNH